MEESAEKGNVGQGIGSLWIPATPAKAILNGNNEFPPGFEPKSQIDESELEEFPPGFEPKVQLAGSDSLCDVCFGVLESARREDCNLEAGYGVSPAQLVYSLARFEMGPFSSLPAMADADRLCCGGSVSGSHTIPVSCLCVPCNMDHPSPSSFISRQPGSFPEASAGDICEGLGGLPEDLSQFSEIMPPQWMVIGAVTQDTSPLLAPVTPDKTGGQQCRNPGTGNDAGTQGLSEEHLTESRCYTQGIELKTPPKKERRKKHRPKVVKEVRLGMTSSRKPTASETGVSTGVGKPKRKYVRRRGTETAQRASLEGRCDAEGEANSNPCAENSTRKRKYVRRKIIVDTPPAEVPSNLTVPIIPCDNSTRKSCRRGLNFEPEGPTKVDKATEVKDDCLNLIAACSPFPRRKRTRTQFSPPTVSDYKEEKAMGTKRDEIPSTTESAQREFEFFHGLVSTGEESAAAAIAPSREFSVPFEEAHQYWALSLSNLQKTTTVNDGRYAITEADHSAADFGLTGGPETALVQDTYLFPSHDYSFISEFPGAVCQTGPVQVAGATASSETSDGIPADHMRAQTSGSRPEFMWNSSHCVKDLVKKLQKLNINKKRAWRKDHNVASYDLTYQQDNALVLYKPAGSIVSFGNLADEPRRRRQRVKVELDDETNRVWQPLLENIDNKGVDRTDEEKAKWWEDERTVFKGRANSFIARMHLVQGDRRFSPWKGSVLDSVVGVFLTQNVSDHLSSSAFMSLAAHYPLKTSRNSSSGEEKTGSAGSDPDGLFVLQENNEESKHDFAGLPLHYGETSVSRPSFQCSAGMDEEIPSQKHKSPGKKKKKEEEFDWDSLRKEAEACRRRTEETPDATDSLDWESVRCAPVSEVASIIKERGMNNRLSQRIKDFLDRMVRDHERLDLEWVRDIPPDKAKEYLLSFRGLGPKSVDCVRLLTLRHLAFPVDTNIGRIAVRLGWVPLQPLPESLQLHLLEMYTILESIQRYLWPRLCMLDQGTLYELHYQMITFGKVFCTKSRPNCNACPMRGECRHFASAFVSARLALPAPEQSFWDGVTEKDPCALNPPELLPLPLPPGKLEMLDIEDLAVACKQSSCQPIIEEPARPEPEYAMVLGNDLDGSTVDFEDDGEIPMIRLDTAEFARNLQMFMQRDTTTREDVMSKALVALPPEASSVPAPLLKCHSRLRTEHLVYEIPQGHPLLDGLDTLEPDDPSQYLLAIWTPGETATSIRPPKGGCNSRDGQHCKEPSCATCNGIQEADSQIVRGTILIPCRTAMRGSFPLNGTYFQVNEVFADHESSLKPFNVPRSLIWNLHRRTVYFGTSVSAIFKGMSTEAIQHCFWRGYVCVRGFDRETRAPRPLVARLHFPASKMAKAKGKTNDEQFFDT